MLVVTHGTGMQEAKEYVIYESEEDRTKAGISYSTVLHETNEGEYFRFDNGYYAPLIFKREYPVEGKPRNTVYEYHFPKCIITKRGTIYRIALDYVINRHIGQAKNPKGRFSANDRYFVQLLLSGIDINIAFVNAYKYNSLSYRKKMIERVFNHPKFKEALMKSDVTKTMKQQLKDAGIDHAFLADTFKDIIADPKAPASLRQYAIEQSMRFLNMEDGSSSQTGPSIAASMYKVG